MPSAAYSTPRPITSLEDATAALRARGLRVSASRKALIEGLLLAEGPVSAEYLAAGLEGRSTPTDLPSAYRNLELLEQLGMVRHVHIGHGPGLYALVGDDDPTYLVCERCDRLSRLPAADADRIRSRIEERTGFRAHFTHFPILGLCARCAGAEEPAEPGGEHSHGGFIHSHPRGGGRGHRHSQDR